ncbi:hypothetical protein M409DRAFT_68079 [Zasmidium cellare ATCC 36951]|uniref:Cytochrome P450 n=1 Tax=Zasmidium cellare ATCC 36951 TaxID=1080233 RepID=A0A6A6CBN8_ZASCE|nr:uncharacterized protein M409DRAFT_68079 [Zasmidium cellare ATCC 36951]KAF2164203.1 hypothetical protein M409DRAFT_68079 [Zasmidium cellare ATCC 36951]
MGSGLFLQLLPSTLGGIAFAVPLLLAFVQIATYAYNLFFHPLRKFPGPITSAISNIPLTAAGLRGDGVYWIVDLHQRYGEVVRVAPNELSFSGNGAYRDIHGHKKAGLRTLEKDPQFYRTPSGERDIVNGDFDDHARMRRVFAHAFSDRALKLQEPLFLTHVDKLIKNMREALIQDRRHKFDMVQMWNFTNFDIMGDLTFGEPLGMLDKSSYHPWVQAMLSSFKFGVYVHSIRHLPLIGRVPSLEGLLLRFCIPKKVLGQMALHKNFSEQRVDTRLEKQDARPDMWGLVLEKEGQNGLTRQEMYSNANLFMIAGTETTATLLSGLTYYLVTHSTKLQKLTDEIRSTFSSETEISIERLQALPYLNACLEESLRMEKKSGFSPFSTGPRACLSKNMAYHEMRLILTKVLYNFDLELCEESQSWIQHKIFIMWEKPPLYCRLRPVS